MRPSGPGIAALGHRRCGRGNRDGEAWQDIGQHVFYRLQRDATLSASAPLQVQTSVRYVRVLTDPRAAAPEPTQTALVVQARLAALVFAQQGQPPFALQTGASGVHSGALPITTLVPQLNEERARMGRAEVGAWTEVADVARAAQSDERKAAMRPWLLWAVLLAGVAGLGFMVWRLLKTRPEA